MEWLSHSQKKHCELCKTPFRFTKLYAPNMPKALPFHIFISHVAQYLLRNMLVWLRAALVTSVWLGWLPYLMRSVWSFLFWISDEGFSRKVSLFGSQHGGMPNGTDLVSTLASRDDAGFCPSTPLLPITTCWSDAAAVDRVSLEPVPRLVRALYSINITHSDRPYAAFFRLVFGGIGANDNADLTLSSVARDTMASRTSAPPTLLSGVGFLRHFTRHEGTNRVIIATIEGQIITVLVIVCFILIILVRDYVVQQQPEINMRAAFAGGEDEVPPQQLNGAPRDDGHMRRGARPIGEGAVERDVQLAEDGHVDETDEQPDEPNELPGRPAVSRRQDAREEAFEVPEDEDLDTGLLSESSDARARDNWFDRSAASRSLRPVDMELARPSHTQGDLSEDDETAVRQFLRIYRQAEGEPHRILELAKEQNLQDKLDWWMQLTRSRIDRHDDLEDTSIKDNTLDRLSRMDGESSAQGRGVPVEALSIEGDGPALGNRGEASISQDKGKSKADDGDFASAFVSGGPARARANTDGPRAKTGISPLANNSWTFADLPTDDRSEPVQDDAFDFQGRFESSDSAVPTPPSSIGAEVSSVRSELLSGHERAVSDGGIGDGPPDSVLGTTLPDDPNFDFNTPPALEPRARRRPPPADFMGRVAEFMWGEVDAIDPAELAPLHVPDELHDNADVPFLDAGQEGDVLMDDERDREVVEAAFAAGLDPDAIEDAEDLEGILELLGMRGPIAGLFQNVIFCAFLVAVTLLLGIFLPYNLGRITVWTLANPMRIVRILFSISKFVQDVAVILCGLVIGTASYAFLWCWRLLGQDRLPPLVGVAVDTSWNMSSDAATRVVQSFMTEMPILSTNEMRNFSALSHGALLTIKDYISTAFWSICQGLEMVFGGAQQFSIFDGISWLLGLGAVAWDALMGLPHMLSDPSSWVISLSLPESSVAVNPELAYWGAMDRFWAVLCGYIAFTVFAALYLRRGVPFSSGTTTQELENSLLDLLKQASGVMKVILIIGIEMLVFPLYCGLLLDIALLPLFEDTTVKSRLLFSYNYPLTSIFVHWFVGTGYMFHFALFVSMCRKIMRKGVLYFIRDPDDPEFHPVRDVLERNVTTQLRKILFSAFVYGALVIICLGGVVWGLSYSMPSVLPIHYSSNEPVLEFPIDLLFYNFLMPLAVKFFKPSDALHTMYTWWFRKCARVLRLTWFLFGSREIDEEGELRLAKDSPHQKDPWWRRLFLEVNEAELSVVPNRWANIWIGGKARPVTSTTMPAEAMERMDSIKGSLAASGQLVPDGRFVRAPASDQIKIPKGKAVFLEVTEKNERQDGKPDDPETDIYSTHQYQLVYIPAFFRVRIFLFILFIWMFAAFTGVGITIVPLVFGRAMFKLFIPAHIRTNDIYAFSIGIYVLGSLAYGVSHARTIVQKTSSWFNAAVSSVASRDAARRAISSAVTASRLLYAYFFLLVVFPIMVISLMELYLLIPLNTWMYSAVFSAPALPPVNASSGPGVVASASVVNIIPRHTVRVIQSWTIGLLFLKLGARVISTWYEGTRLSAAVRAVLRRGWLDPDVAVLTRAFVVPGLVIWAILVSVPLLVGRTLVVYGAAENIIAHVADAIPANRGIVIGGIDRSDANMVRTDQLDKQLMDAVTALIYRLSFPLTALGVATAAACWNIIDIFQGWKIRIRDEAYLIGERLHNFGAGNGPARVRGAWRAGGARL